MKAMPEPMMVAASTKRLARSAHAPVQGVAAIAALSHGLARLLITPNSPQIGLFHLTIGPAPNTRPLILLAQLALLWQYSS
jgi:hypothetical protein